MSHSTAPRMSAGKKIRNAISRSDRMPSLLVELGHFGLKADRASGIEQQEAGQQLYCHSNAPARPASQTRRMEGTFLKEPNQF
jgi:hypothetical protein